MKRLGIAALGLVLGQGAVAQDMTLGEFEYMNSCAACHGETGAGNGPVSAYMTPPAPSLRTLSADNGGVFPVSRLYEVIDGSARVAQHGMMDMPVWGYRLSQRIGPEDVDFRESDVESYVRLRILALLDHIAGMQD